MSLMPVKQPPGSAPERNFDLEDFVDLKSVSTYGWRVDLERIRSKYFVDLLRPRGADGKQTEKTPQPKLEKEDKKQKGKKEIINRKQQILDQINRIKIEGGKQIRKEQEQRGGSALGKPPLPKFNEEEANERSFDQNNEKSNKPVVQQHKKVLSTPLPARAFLRSAMEKRFENNIHSPQKVHPVPGQYDPRYNSIQGQPYQNVIISKGDRFLAKDRFQTWLNKPQFINTISDSKKPKTAGPVTPANLALEWAQNDHLSSPLKDNEASRNGSSANHLHLGKEINEFALPQPSSFTATQSRFKTANSMGASPLYTSGLRTPGSFLNFEKQVARKDLASLINFPNPHESRFENYSPFSPPKNHQFQFENQSKRPEFQKSNYISKGGFSYNFENAIEQFRYTSEIKKALPFERVKVDYAKVRQLVDVKELMKQRRKENQSKKQRQRQIRHDDKWTIQ